jgi:hypothetical protein
MFISASSAYCRSGVPKAELSRRSRARRHLDGSVGVVGCFVVKCRVLCAIHRHGPMVPAGLAAASPEHGLDRNGGAILSGLGLTLSVEWHFAQYSSARRRPCSTLEAAVGFEESSKPATSMAPAMAGPVRRSVLTSCSISATSSREQSYCGTFPA